MMIPQMIVQGRPLTCTVAARSCTSAADLRVPHLQTAAYVKRGQCVCMCKILCVCVFEGVLECVRVCVTMCVIVSGQTRVWLGILVCVCVTAKI